MIGSKAPLAAAVAALLAAGGAAPVTTMAWAQAQSAVEASVFVEGLAARAFSVLKGDRPTARNQFRTLLAQNFALDLLGDRLIRSWRQRITPAQYAAYKAAVPDFIVGTYANRLRDYAGADLRVVRVQNHSGNAAILTQVTRPGARPVTVIWTLTRAGERYKVSNMTVGGVNLALSQEADFNSYAQRNGFDALITFMKRRG